MSVLQHSLASIPAYESGPMPSQLSWFAIQTRPRYEKKVSTELREKGVKIFLPLHSAAHQWSDRRQVVDTPLFPGYVFVQIPPCMEARIWVLRTNGVINFVGVRNVGVPIPDCEIKAVQAVIEAGHMFESHPYLKVGQHVRIRGGCLNGVSGVLMSVSGDQSLVVSVNLIERSIVLRIKGYKIEAL